MSLPNLLTFLRLPLLFAIVGFLMSAQKGFATYALVAFLLAFLSDWLDGFFARLFNQVTSVGATLDALIDKIFVLGLFLYFFHISLIPAWGFLPLLIILAREFLITGLRMCALMRHRVMAAEQPGKIKTVVQFCSLFFFVLTLFVQRELGGSPAVMAVGDFLKFAGRLTFAVAAFFTLTSGFYYLWRYRDLLATPREETPA